MIFIKQRFMAHSAVQGYFPIQKQNKNSNKLTEEKSSENVSVDVQSLAELT